MSKSVTFRNDNSSEYTIKVARGLIKVDYYFSGSISGGSGTEGGYSVGKKGTLKFLEQLKFENLEEFMNTIKKFNFAEWLKIEKKLAEYGSNSWSWSETNWDD